ncbi:BamA/TamA family outer membrane protein, partial [Gemmatimonadota bacterium]
AGGLLAQGSLAGSEKGTLSGLGVVVQWDTRDNIFAPWTGGYYRLLAMGFGSGLGSTWSFSEVSLDLRRFLNTGGGRVLATQIALWDAAGSVPFFRLAMLGGPLLLRGYFEGRYRNRAGAVVQAEYRVPVSRIIGLAGFGGVGDVADRLSDLDATKARVAWGVGLRWSLNPEERQGLRFDFGFGEGSTGFYVTFGEAF